MAERAGGQQAGSPQPAARRARRHRLRWRHLGLRVRLTALFAAATIVLVALGGLGLALVVHKGLLDNVDASLRARLDQIDADALLGAGSDAPPHAGAGDESATQVISRDGGVLYSQPPGAAALIDASDAAAAQAEPRSRTITVHGQRMRVAWMADAGAERVLVAATSLAASEDDTADIDAALLWTAPIIVIVAAAATWLLAGAALGPVERMRTDAAAISSTDSDRRISVPPAEDSLAALARTLNQMLDRLHAALRREREFVADAGHELRTPLAVLRTELELASRPGRSAEELREAIAHASAEADRLIALSTALLELARAETAPVAAASADVSSVLDEAIRARRGAALDAEVDLVADYLPSARASIDPASLRQVIDNVLSNALRFTPAGGAVVVRAEPAPGWLDVHIVDSGPGMPPGFLGSAFDRFRMADASRADPGGANGAHAGLGLAIARAIVVAAGGSIAAANLPEGGLDVRIRLRAAPEAEAEAGA